MPRSNDLRWAGIVASSGCRIRGALPFRAQSSGSRQSVDPSAIVGDSKRRCSPSPCAARRNLEFLLPRRGMMRRFENLDRTRGPSRSPSRAQLWWLRRLAAESRHANALTLSVTSRRSAETPKAVIDARSENFTR